MERSFCNSLIILTIFRYYKFVLVAPLHSPNLNVSLYRFWSFLNYVIIKISNSFFFLVKQDIVLRRTPFFSKIEEKILRESFFIRPLSDCVFHDPEFMKWNSRWNRSAVNFYSFETSSRIGVSTIRRDTPCAGDRIFPWNLISGRRRNKTRGESMKEIGGEAIFLGFMDLG